MATSSLVTHCGARVVTAEDLKKVPAPQATKTWYPLAHAHVLERVTATLGQAGFAVERQKLALTRNDARFFGTLDLRSPLTAGVNLAVGIRNSTDKSLPIGFAAGSRVFVCDNLAFSSEVVVARKHTRFGDERFAEALTRAVEGLHQFREAEAARINRFQATALSDTEAESLILRAYEADVVSHRLLPRVIGEWRKPSFEEFQERTLWSLFNCFTAVLADRQRSNPQQFSALTIKLSDLLGRAAGIDAAEPRVETAA